MPTDNPPPRMQPFRWFKRFQRQNTVLTISGDQDRELILSLSPKRIPSWKQLAFLPRLLNRVERRWMRLLLLIAGLSILLMIGRQITIHLEFIPADGGTVTEGLVGSPQYINPILARPFTSDTDLTKLVYRGLVSFDQQLQPQPDLAESVGVSADGKTYTVILRRNLHWADGSLITPSDVLYTYETIADAAYQSPLHTTFGNVTVATTDERTVTFTLPAASPSFMAALSLGILPAEHWQDQTPQTFPLAELNVKPIGSGPYKFQSVTKDRTGNIKAYAFVRNKLYDGPRPHIDKLNIKLYPDVASAIDALHSDAIDSLGGIGLTDLATVKKKNAVDTMLVSQLTGVFFNTKTNVAMKSLEVRQALALATDRTTLIKQGLQDAGAVLTGPLIPGIPGYSADAKRTEFNREAAAAKLEQAGWKLGDNGWRMKDKQQLSFTLTTADDPTYTGIAQLLVEAWKGIGANVTLRIVPAEDVQKDVIKDRTYDAFLFGQLVDAGGDLYPLWHSSQQQASGIALAINFIKNADADLEKARSAKDEDTRAAALKDFQNLVIDQVPAIIIAQNGYLYAHQRNLRGLGTSRMVGADDHWQNIASWYLKRRWHWK